MALRINLNNTCKAICMQQSDLCARALSCKPNKAESAARGPYLAPTADAAAVHEERKKAPTSTSYRGHIVSCIDTHTHFAE